MPGSVSRDAHERSGAARVSTQDRKGARALQPAVLETAYVSDECREVICEYKSCNINKNITKDRNE